LFAAVAVAGLLGSYLLVYSLGTGRVGADAAVTAGDETSRDWCGAAAIAVDALGEIDPGRESLERGIAALVDLREAAPVLAADLDVLIDAYQGLADGDLTALGDPEQISAVDAAAAGLVGALGATCDLDAAGSGG
jgi:hypothetical protein